MRGMKKEFFILRTMRRKRERESDLSDIHRKRLVSKRKKGSIRSKIVFDPLRVVCDEMNLVLIFDVRSITQWHIKI